MKKASYSQRANEYARKVVAGQILASKWIKLACQRHLDDLSNPDCRWHFDEARVTKICAFAEKYRHEKGELQGQRLILQPWQIFILAQIYGWVDVDGIRKYREALLLIPRGQGKSPLAAIIAVWMAFFDGEKGAEVYTAATTEKQALEVFRPARSFIEQEPAFAKMGIVAAAKSIFQASTRSRFTPVIGRSKYGGAPYCAIMDEAHQLPDSELYDSFKTGCNKRKNSLLLTISTAGVSSTENPCYQLQQDGQKVLEGVIPNDRLLVIIHCADDTVDWSSRDAVRMANPNLGISNIEESIFLDHDEAIRNPAKQNVFRAMHLNQWSTAASSWMNMQTFRSCEDATLRIEDFAEDSCWLGLDTASKIDLNSIAILFKRMIEGKEHYYLFSRNYQNEGQINLPQNQHYQRWEKQGQLIKFDGNATDFLMLENDLVGLVKTNQVERLCFDPAHGAWGCVQKVQLEVSVQEQETPQKPAVLSPAMREIEAAVADGRFHYAPNDVLVWCFANIVTSESGSSLYRMPDKEKTEYKIDSAMAALFSMTHAMLFEVPESTAWSFAPFLI